MMNKKNCLLFTLFAAVMLTLSISVTFASQPSEISTQYYAVMPTPQSPPPPFVEMGLQPIGESGNLMVTWTDLPVVFYGGEISGTGFYNGHTLLGSEGEIIASHGVITLFDATVDEKTGDLTIVMGVDHWRIIDGTGELTEIHGGGTSEDSETLGIYIIQGFIHFD
jgi:hypothetical protein